MKTKLTNAFSFLSLLLALQVFPQGNEEKDPRVDIHAYMEQIQPITDEAISVTLKVQQDLTADKVSSALVNKSLSNMKNSLPELTAKLNAIEPLWNETIYRPVALEFLNFLRNAASNELPEVAAIMTQDSVSPEEFAEASAIFDQYRNEASSQQEKLNDAEIELQLHYYYRERSGDFCKRLKVVTSHASINFEKLKGDELNSEEWDNKQNIPGADTDKVRKWGSDMQAYYRFYRDESFSDGEWAFYQLSMYLHACELPDYELSEYESYTAQEMENGKVSNMALDNHSNNAAIHLQMYPSFYFTEDYKSVDVYEVALTVTKYKE